MKKLMSLSIIALTCFNSFSQQIINVTEQTIKLNRMHEEELYFGFAAGDQIIFNFSEINGKELKEIEVIEYPSNSKFSDFKTSKIENKVLNVLKTAVYKFRFQNNALTGRVCKIRIQRIPASEETKLFNSQIIWIERQDTIWNSFTKDVVVGYDTTYEQKSKLEVVKTEQREELLFDKTQRVHSTTNENKNRTAIFFTLPKNEVIGNKMTIVASWAYWVGVGEESNQAWNQNLRVITNLAKGVAGFSTPLGALAVGAVSDLAITNIGEDVGYSITDMANKNLFLAGYAYRLHDQGKGVVGYRKFTDRSLSQGTYAVCLSNDNVMQGINVTVKVVAIIETKFFENKQYTEEIIVPRYEKRIFKEPSIQKKVKVPIAVNQ